MWWVLWLMAACNPAGRRLDDGRALLAEGRWDDAVAVFDEVAATWPDAEEAGVAGGLAVEAMVERTVEAYEADDLDGTRASVRQLHDRIGAAAEGRIVARVGDGFTPSMRYVDLVDAGRTDATLTSMLDDVLGASATPPAVHERARRWGCDAREGFPAYATCRDGAPAPDADDAARMEQSRPVLSACALLVRLGDHCDPEVRTAIADLRDAAVARFVPPEPEPMSRVVALRTEPEIGRYAGLLAVLGATGDTAVLGAGPGDTSLFGAADPELYGGIGGLIGSGAAYSSSGGGSGLGGGGLGSRGSGLGGGGSADGIGGLGTMGSRASVAVTSDTPALSAGLDTSLYLEVVKRHMSQIRYCYQRELTKTPDLAGTLDVAAEIAADGRVTSAKATASAGMSAVESCVTGRFLRMQFPEPTSGPVTVTQRLTFAPAP